MSFDEKEPPNEATHEAIRNPVEGKIQKMELVTDALAEVGTVSEACRRAGIARATYYRWLDDDPAFQAQVDEAQEAHNDAIRNEIERRAVEGVRKPVGFYKGEHGGTFVQEYSDTLLIFHAKARMPEYRDKVDVQQTIKLDRIDWDQLPNSVIDRIANRENAFAVLASYIDQGNELPLLPGGKRSLMTRPVDPGGEPSDNDGSHQ
ncbi:MAG: hypothetical protein GEU90_20460 [Gemmatimonas sp.]|nr:hypothetical protein [Gemmatimonas sp.]